MADKHWPVLYYVEVYEPDSARDVLWTYNTASPLGAIAEGDLLTIGDLDREQGGGHGAPLNVLRVTRVEHILWGFKEGKNDVPAGVRHKVMIFTTALENVAAIRHDRSKDKPWGGK